MNKYNPPKPKYKDGDKVICSLITDKIFTIVDSPKWNGSSWMYAFKDETMRCGERYLAPHKDVNQ